MERISKLMAHRGLCSRREAEQLIADGRVRVNGTLVDRQGTKAEPDAVIEILEDIGSPAVKRLTVLLNKPPGFVSGHLESGQTGVWELLQRKNLHGDADPDLVRKIVTHPNRLSVAGRLDKASRGLLVLTEDGIVARRLIGEGKAPKIYRVRVAETVSPSQVRKLCGIPELDGKPLRPMKVQRLSEKELRFELLEGRKHQIRRACRRVGLQVTDLVRIVIGPLRLSGLPEGRWRLATDEETERLRGGKT